MAGLKIDFNCMCLLVTGKQEDTVHVLMPNTADLGHHQHVVRLVYRNKKGKLILAPMEGWSLSMGVASTPVKGELDPAESVRREAAIVNLSDITGEYIDPKLVTGVDTKRVISRVTLVGAQVDAVKAQTKHKWLLDGKEFFMAHQVSFRVDNVPDALPWVSLGKTGTPIPLASLGDVKSEGKDNGVKTYALKVYHVLEQDLPPSLNPKLSEAETRHHFAAFYELLGLNNPPDKLLPKREVSSQSRGGSDPTGMEYCKTAQVRM